MHWYKVFMVEKKALKDLVAMKPLRPHFMQRNGEKKN